MKRPHSAEKAGQGTPSNEEAHGSPQTAGPKDHETQHRNTSDYRVPQQVGHESGVMLPLLALWMFAGHLVRLKHLGLALWITRYDLAPDCRGVGK